MKVLAFCSFFVFGVVATGIAAPASDESDADILNPDVLIQKVKDNVAKIDTLNVTFTQTVGDSPASGSRATFVFQPSQGKAKVSRDGQAGNAEWMIDINENLLITRTPGGESSLPLSDFVGSRPASLRDFAPPSPSFYCFDDYYRGYSFRISEPPVLGSNQTVVVDGELPGFPGAGKVQLVVDVEQGLLKAERFSTRTGTLVREISYEDYRDFGGVRLPMKVVERHIGRMKEARIIHTASDVSVKTAGAGSAKSRKARRG